MEREVFDAVFHGTYDGSGTTRTSAQTHARSRPHTHAAYTALRLGEYRDQLPMETHPDVYQEQHLSMCRNNKGKRDSENSKLKLWAADARAQQWPMGVASFVKLIRGRLLILGTSGLVARLVWARPSLGVICLPRSGPG